MCYNDSAPADGGGIFSLRSGAAGVCFDGVIYCLPRGMIMLFLFLSAFPSTSDADASLRDVNVREAEIPSGAS